jgi:hypothetical protein
MPDEGLASSSTITGVRLMKYWLGNHSAGIH